MAIALSVAQGRREHVGGDFQVFWQAGRNFATGNPLYHDYLPGARLFKYPPFAAFVFQVLAPFPIQVAAALLCLLNLALWVAAVYLSRDIVERTFPDRGPTRLALMVAVILSAQFFLDNFHHAQVNGIILVLVLLGIRAYLGERDRKAAAYLVTATAIKVTPVFFVLWLLIRGRRRAVLAVFPLAIGCVLLPLAIRGPSTGVADVVQYFHLFRESRGHEDVRNYNQNLSGFIGRMTQPTDNAERISYTYFPTSERVSRLATLALAATVLLCFVVALGRLRVRRAPVSALELSLVFVTSLLLAPITLPAHFVSMVFVFYAVLSIGVSRPSPGRCFVAAGVVGLMVMTGLSGRDLVGRTGYLYARGYSVYVWMLLALLALSLALLGQGRVASRTAGEPRS